MVGINCSAISGGWSGFHRDEALKAALGRLPQCVTPKCCLTMVLPSNHLRCTLLHHGTHHLPMDRAHRHPTGRSIVHVRDHRGHFRRDRGKRHPLRSQDLSAAARRIEKVHPVFLARLRASSDGSHTQIAVPLSSGRDACPAGWTAVSHFHHARGDGGSMSAAWMSDRITSSYLWQHA